MSSDLMIDSGLGRTLSSLGRMPRLRSRSEERKLMAPSLNGHLGPQFTARSDPITCPSNAKNYSGYHKKQTDYTSQETSVLAGIPAPPRSQVLSKVSSQHSEHDNKRKDAERQQSERHNRWEKGIKNVGETNVNAKLQISPLKSERLMPTRHKTKNAVLTILENGEVCIEFLKRKNMMERVSEVCHISNDGLRIVLYKPKELKGISDEPPPIPIAGADNIYSYESLPSRHHRKYLYAARFIKLVKAKTPKLTLYTVRAKCLFMENGPHPDCEVYFYNGIKVCCIFFLIYKLLIDLLVTY